MSRSVVPVEVQIKPNPRSAPGLGYNTRRFDCRAIDRTATDYFHQTQDPTADVVIDLTPVTYLEHECLIHLGAVVKASRAAGREVRLRLAMDNGRPTDSVEFMRAWLLPPFIANITGRDFVHSLTNDVARIWRSLPPPKYEPVTTGPLGERVKLLPRECFWLTPIPCLMSPIMAARAGRDHFLRANLKAVLERILGDKRGEDKRARKLATQAVYEAVLNAALHPHAGLAYFTIQIRPPRIEDGDEYRFGSLEISIWDDGESVGGTLRSALGNGFPITTEFFSELKDERFYVAVNPSPDLEEVEYTLVSHDTPPTAYQDDELLLTVSAFLTGVTSQPGLLRFVNDDFELDPDDPEITREIRERGGVGLRALRRTVIDLLHGQIRYYSGLERITITRWEGLENSYRVNVMRDEPDKCWSAAGNHLQIRIPLANPERPPE